MIRFQERNYFKVFSIFFKIVIVLVAVFVCTKIGLYKHALHKRRQEVVNTKDHYELSPEVLQRLNQLTAIPIVGTFYLQPKAQELIRLQRFEEGLQIVTELVSSELNKRSFSLWYSKAQAEFGLDLFQECQQTLTKASVLSRGRWHDYLLSKLMDKVNNHKAYQQLQTIAYSNKQDKEKDKDYERELVNRLNQVL